MTRLAVLGAIAGLAAAVSPALSADLPVAPEPVDYVRICDAYGARLYYIPGSETCLRAGGRVRADYRIRNFGEDQNAWGDRNTDGYQFRARGYLYLDARTATQYGTLRTFIEMYMTSQSGADTSTLEKAFIQWGGLLAGRDQSNFDFFTGYAFGAQTAGYSDQKINQVAYTAAFGDGFYATLAVEDRSERDAGIGSTLFPSIGYGATRIPDFVAALGVSQGWGQAQVMGATHQIYTNSTANSLSNGSEDEFGWAIGAGVEVNFGGLAQGGSVALQGVYTDGASLYANNDFDGRITDAVFINGGVNTTKTWGILGGVNLGLTPTIQANVEGGYFKVDGGASAYDFTQIDASANVVWEPISGLEIGPELQYRDLDYSAASGLSDTYELYGTFRIQRTF
ncbi:porin [Roseibium aggregatum]|uniref:Porin n=1 Tax=Roseibium aggregatum TaxID=187304 RepID=A0A939E907_9HYPH|nr:porin [Roseibium aggregatum]MBN9669091.1 porin [Roseibium aggregatum]